MKIINGNPFKPLLSIVFVVLATVTFAQRVEVNEAKIHQEVDEATSNVLDNLFNAFEALDADRCIAVSATGEKVLHISNMNIVQVDTISNYTRAAFKQIEYFKAKWNPVDLKVLSPEIALRVAKVSFNVKRKNEPETSTSGIQTFIFKKIGSEWKIVHDQRVMN